MENLVLFRDRQEVQEADLDNIQLFARATVDRVVREGLTDERRFTGFAVAKAGATSVSIAAGAYWNQGKVHVRESVHSIDLLAQLPLVTKKIATIALVASDIETDIQPRDFLTDVDTEATEAQSVAMEAIRYVEFQVVYGLESSAPQKATLSTDVVPIAHITLSTTGVDIVERAGDFELVSTKKLNARTTDLESWRVRAGDRIETLGSDLSALNLSIKGITSRTVIDQIASDVAEIKERLEIEDDYTSYGAFRFLDLDGSDTDALTYAAKVEEGVRFPDANASEVALQLFNPLESKVKVHSGTGLVLPDYTEVQRASSSGAGAQLGEISISQYQFQTVTWKLKQMSAQRLRFGKAFTVCENSAWWGSGQYDWKTGVFTALDGRTYQALDTAFDKRAGDTGPRSHLRSSGKEKFIRFQEFWLDTETEYYQDRVVTDYAVSGSILAQTWLSTQHGWLTSIDVDVTQVGPSGDVTMILCETRDGKPLPTKALAASVKPYADLVTGTVKFGFRPTAIEPGKIYAIVLQSAGNHYIRTSTDVPGQQFAGTLFTSTDGAFFQGDLERDLVFAINCAQFKRSRTEVDLASLSLSGGMREIDVLAEVIEQEGSSVTFECRPDGTGTWYPLTDPANSPFTIGPVLVHFRAVFLGTSDVMPGVRFTGSRVRVSRSAIAKKWISDPIEMATATQSLKIIVVLDRYRELNHDLTCTIDDVTNSDAAVAPATVTDVVLRDYDGTYERVQRTFEWTATELPVTTDEIVINLSGAATSAAEVFHVEKLVWLGF